MTPIEFSQIVSLGLKILLLFGIGLYTVFAAIFVRQEQLMSHVLEETFEPVLRILVVLHLAASIGIFILALVIL